LTSGPNLKEDEKFSERTEKISPKPRRQSHHMIKSHSVSVPSRTVSLAIDSEKHRDRDTEKHRDKEKHRDTEKHRDRATEHRTEKSRDGGSEKSRDRDTEKHRDKDFERHRDIERYKDRETGKQRDTERHTRSDTEKYTREKDISEKSDDTAMNRANQFSVIRVTRMSTKNKGPAK